MFFGRLLLMAVAATLACGTETVGPSEFYAVSVFFSDSGALFYYRVIDVRPDGPDSLIRYTRVAPMNSYCPRMIVQSSTARVSNMTPFQLVKDNNPCMVKPGTLQAALKKFQRKAGVFETISFGIVAECGSSPVTLGLPIDQSVHMEHMKKTHPEIARLWELIAEITDQTFGLKDIFYDRTPEEDLVLQRAGEDVVPDLIAGRYDIGLAAAVKGNVGRWRSPTFRSLLGNYQGPASETEVKTSFVPQLLNAQEYTFAKFVPPSYPPLARQARIQGKVTLQLALDAATGEVQGATVVSGHPLLMPSAIEAVKQWRFVPDASDPQMVSVTLEFALRCP
jgi:TonB family protein